MFKAGAAKIDITPQVGCWPEGIPRAEPSNAIHFTITADFPGYTADLIEKELGGVALFTNAARAVLISKALKAVISTGLRGADGRWAGLSWMCVGGSVFSLNAEDLICRNTEVLLTFLG